MAEFSDAQKEELRATPEFSRFKEALKEQVQQAAREDGDFREAAKDFVARAKEIQSGGGPMSKTEAPSDDGMYSFFTGPFG